MIDDRMRQLTQLLLEHDPIYTYSDMAEASGVDHDLVVLLWQALGLATPNRDAVMFTGADVTALRLVHQLMSERGASVRTALAAARGWGQAMARTAEWQADMVRELADATPYGADATGDRRADPGQAQDHVLRIGTDMMPAVAHFQQYVWRRHLLAAAERLLSSTTASDGGSDVAVGFADIAGYTQISRGLSESRLARFIDTFEAQSTSIVTACGGRVVKTIGDEVMFVTDAPRAAAEIALRLSELTSGLDGRPLLHTGVARGHVLHHLGDVHGTVVNLASRLTSLARPGTVLIDTALADALTAAEIPTPGPENPYDVRKLRPLALRGFPHVQPWLLRRTDCPAPHGRPRILKPHVS